MNTPQEMHLTLPPYLRPWIPAVRKVALDKNVHLDDSQVKQVLMAADAHLKRKHPQHHSRGLITPEQMALAIKAVFKDTLDEMADQSQKQRETWLRQDYQQFTKRGIIPRREFMDLRAKDQDFEL